MRSGRTTELINEIVFPDLESLLDDQSIGPLLDFSHGPETLNNLGDSSKEKQKQQFRWVTIDRDSIQIVADRLEELGRTQSAIFLREESERRDTEFQIRIVSLRTIA